ncbi:lipid-A-disaccharide synthase [Prosthecomicrobium sp. N25]|uniref:lipid-A-disaccharide synthase n=1 Tax=Prosthecomicrobium sp. N25 TaxID=3129254 RepID=UPI00307738B3
MAEALKVFLVAGESSGDQLGASLMAGLRRAVPSPRFEGVGGPAMAAAGLASLFPMSDIAVMGIGPVLARLPLLLRRIAETAAAVLAARPDVLVLIDSPDFCRRVARRVRAVRPDLPIVVYVSPTVWAWRPGRARKLAAFCDRLLAVLPFEPEVHRILGGPPTVYVGHPALESLAGIRAERSGGQAEVPAIRQLVVLPGSRRTEVGRLMPLFGAVIDRLRTEVGPVEATLPAVPHLLGEIERLAAAWPVRPRIVTGEAAKRAAFGDAEVALAASGTVTLELALARVPTVVAYRLDWLGRRAKRLVRVPKGLEGVIRVRSVVLPNLIAGEAAVPEFIDEAATPAALAGAVAELLRGGPARDSQLALFDRLDDLMRLPDGQKPADAAAAAVLQAARRQPG